MRKADVSQEVMKRIGRQLIAEKKAAIIADSQEKGRSIEKKDVSGRDLLTLLIKANMATDIPDNQRLSDDEVLAREYLNPRPINHPRSDWLRLIQRSPRE